MKVNDIRKRVINNIKMPYGPLIDSFSDLDSCLWPYELWPRDGFDRPLCAGAIGGHGDTKYCVETYLPGKKIEFRFISPKGYQGTHGFEVRELPGGAVEVRHVTDVNFSLYHWVMWKLIIFWVHEALIEDSLDKAECFLLGQELMPRKWLLRVHFIRHGLGLARIIKHFILSMFNPSKLIALLRRLSSSKGSKKNCSR